MKRPWSSRRCAQKEASQNALSKLLFLTSLWLTAATSSLDCATRAAAAPVLRRRNFRTLGWQTRARLPHGDAPQPSCGRFGHPAPRSAHFGRAPGCRVPAGSSRLAIWLLVMIILGVFKPVQAVGPEEQLRDTLCFLATGLLQAAATTNQLTRGRRPPPREQPPQLSLIHI